MTTGYSGTPLAKKLGIKSGHRVALIDAPAEFESILIGLPGDSLTERLDATDVAGHDVVVAFVKSVADLIKNLFAAAPQMPADGGLWIAWPKRSSGVATELAEGRVRDVAIPTGLVDNKVCAIDQTWSGLRLVVRKEHRSGWPGNFPVNAG